MDIKVDNVQQITQTDNVGKVQNTGSDFKFTLISNIEEHNRFYAA